MPTTRLTRKQRERALLLIRAANEELKKKGEEPCYSMRNYLAPILNKPGWFVDLRFGTRVDLKNA